jgi:hypothetical protein
MYWTMGYSVIILTVKLKRLRNINLKYEISDKLTNKIPENWTD